MGKLETKMKITNVPRKMNNKRKRNKKETKSKITGKRYSRFVHIIYHRMHFLKRLQKVWYAIWVSNVYLVLIQPSRIFCSILILSAVFLYGSVMAHIALLKDEYLA